jgi:hypothetical protein
MKIKVVLASAAVVAVAMVAFAFAPAKFAPVTYYYKSGFNYQRLQFNTTNADPIERSLDQDPNVSTSPVFKNTGSWQINTVSFTSTADMSKYIGSISFNEETTADGGSDGQLTLQEAINALHAQYLSAQAMPSSLTVDGSASITVTAATLAH